MDGSALVDTEEVLSGLVPLLRRLLARCARRFGLMWRWRESVARVDSTVDTARSDFTLKLDNDNTRAAANEGHVFDGNYFASFLRRRETWPVGVTCAVWQSNPPLARKRRPPASTPRSRVERGCRRCFVAM
jgi:hypothetical protein